MSGKTKNQGALRYNVAQLLKGTTGAQRKYELEADTHNLDPELEPVQPLTGSITLMRTSQGILATGQLHTALRAECRRCLVPCITEVGIELEEEFYPAVRIEESPVDEIPEEDRDEALRIDEHHILDLSEVIRQGLWLSGPAEAVCQPDCAGICAHCGGNLNLDECTCEEVTIDPRWAALEGLLTEEIDS